MKQLSRLGIQRMIDTQPGDGGGVGSGDDILMGYATELWTERNYISKAFFNRLFEVYGHGASSSDPDVQVEPNDVDSTITNIKAMFGFWTEQYLSALGLGEGGGGDVELNEPLNSINVAGLATHPSASGQTIIWNGSSWVYGQAGSTGVTSVALAVPTGFSVTGSPITSSGTIRIGFVTGYGLPLTADVNKGVTAYGWGNHANAGYALAANVYSKADADAKFMTIAAFENVFNPLNSSGNKVAHPYSSSVASIKAMFGLWTDQYMSALGLGSGGGSGFSLNEPLNSINNASMGLPSNSGQAVVYNGSSWVYSGSTTLRASIFDGTTVNAYTVNASTGGMSSVGSITISQGGVNAHSTVKAGNIKIGASSTVSGVSCTTIESLNSRGIYVNSGSAPSFTHSAWITSSDMRLKRVMSYVSADIRLIADAPIFNFKWRDGDDMMLGSSAQYWQTVFPCAVKGGPDSFLSMDYAGAAMASAVIAARKIVDQEKRIAQLDAEVRRLSKIIEDYGI